MKTEEQLRNVEGGRIICPAELANAAIAEGYEPILDFPDIARENNRQMLLDDAGMLEKASGVAIKNVDELGLLEEIDYKGQIIADPFLYAYNSEAAGFYRNIFPGIMFIAPDELTDSEISKMDGSGELIYKIYGRQRLMFTAQDIAANYNANEKCLELESMKHDRFVTDWGKYGYTTVYTADPVYMIDKLSELKWKRLLIDFTNESGTQVRDVVSVLKTAIGGEDAAASFEFTRGHHYKGID